MVGREPHGITVATALGFHYRTDFGNKWLLMRSAHRPVSDTTARLPINVAGQVSLGAPIKNSIRFGP